MESSSYFIRRDQLFYTSSCHSFTKQNGKPRTDRMYGTNDLTLKTFAGIAALKKKTILFDRNGLFDDGDSLRRIFFRDVQIKRGQCKRLEWISRTYKLLLYFKLNFAFSTRLFRRTYSVYSFNLTRTITNLVYLACEQKRTTKTYVLHE